MLPAQFDPNASLLDLAGSGRDALRPAADGEPDASDASGVLGSPVAAHARRLEPLTRVARQSGTAAARARFPSTAGPSGCTSAAASGASPGPGSASSSSSRRESTTRL